VFGTIEFDLKYAARSLLKRPAFTITAVLTIALAMAANATVFSVVNAVVFRARPVHKSADLTTVYVRDMEEPQSHLPVSYPDYLTIRDRANTLASVAAYSPLAGALGRGESTEFASGELVSPNYFETLGVAMSMGRAFAANDGTQSLVILSYGLWQRRFNADPFVLGKSIDVNSDPFTVIGVAPEKFSGLIRGVSPSFWITTDAPGGIPFDDRQALTDRRVRIFWVIARIAAGTGMAGADANIHEIGVQIREEHPESRTEQGFVSIPLDRIAVHPDVDTVIYPAAAVVTIISAFVLVIACVNLAGLTLSVAASKSKDIATRLAVGAPRWRIIQPLLLESTLIAAGGGISGLALAAAATRVLQAVPLPFPVPVFLDLAIDARVLAFTAAMTIMAALMFGLVPALRVSNPNVSHVLTEETGFVAGGRGRSRARRLLVVAQVALSVVLIVLSGLTVRSMNNADRIDPGFDRNGLAVGSINVGVRNYTRGRGRVFFRRLLDELQTMPGVESAAITSHVPLSMSIELVRTAAQTQQAIPENERLAADTAAVSRNYFRTMRIPVVQGREFDERDTNSSMDVAIVNETLAKRLWPDGAVLGRKLLVGPPGRMVAEVVGVARDGKYRTIGEAPLPFVYLNVEQRYHSVVNCIVRPSRRMASAATAISALRSALHQLDPDVPLYGLQSVDQRIGISIALPRYAAVLFGALALLGGLLASVGLHGIVAYSVSERRREIGVRMSIGSSPAASLWLVLREGLRMTAAGIGVGLVLAALAGGFLSSILYGVTPRDPLTFAGAALLMLATTIFACWIPARRASRVDPATVLRYQ
jgi:predicted permease